MRFERRDEPFEVTTAAVGTVVEQFIRNPTEAGLAYVELLAVSYDKGTIAGVAIPKAQFKLTPRDHPAAGGGDVYHTFACLDSYQQNRMPFGIRTNPGEVVKVQVLHNLAATGVWRLERLLAFND